MSQVPVLFLKLKFSPYTSISRISVPLVFPIVNTTKILLLNLGSLQYFKQQLNLNFEIWEVGRLNS